MNIIIYENATNIIIYAGQLKSNLKEISNLILIDHMRIEKLKFDNLSYDITDDYLDFIDDSLLDDSETILKIRKYTKKYNELNITSKKEFYLSQIVKQIAFDKINAIVPPWMQRNYIAEGVILLDKDKSTWTQEDIEKSNRLKLTWGRIKHYQDASNLIEQEVLLDANYDMENSPLWNE